MQANSNSRYVSIAALAGFVSGALAMMTIANRADPQASELFDLRNDERWSLVDPDPCIRPRQPLLA